MNRASTLCLILTVLAASGCRQHKISMQPSARTFTPESYISVWDAWTREKETFSWKELAHEIHVAATFESWEFRWAYVVRYAYDYSLKPEARDEMLDASLASSRQEHRFFVTLSGMDFRESNLAGKTSAWRVLLIDPEGNQTVPLLMERVKRPTAVDRVYFPQVSPYRQTFRLTFPAVEADGRKTIPDGAEFILLRFTGARGRADLRWDLQPSKGG